MAVLKELILTVSNLRGCGCLQRSDFYSFYFWEGVVVLKERDLTILTLGRCSGLERTDFTTFYFGKVWQY